MWCFIKLLNYFITLQHASSYIRAWPCFFVLGWIQTCVLQSSGLSLCGLLSYVPWHVHNHQSKLFSYSYSYSVCALSTLAKSIHYWVMAESPLEAPCGLVDLDSPRDLQTSWEAPAKSAKLGEVQTFGFNYTKVCTDGSPASNKQIKLAVEVQAKLSPPAMWRSLSSLQRHFTPKLTARQNSRREGSFRLFLICTKWLKHYFLLDE